MTRFYYNNVAENLSISSIKKVKPVKHPCDEGPSLAGQGHVIVIVAEHVILKIIILKQRHAVNCGILEF